MSRWLWPRSSRCAALLLALDQVTCGRPFGLLKLGAAAGLNLCDDRYSYQLGALSTGVPDSPVRIAPTSTGGVPPVGPPPIASWRLGAICPLWTFATTPRPTGCARSSGRSRHPSRRPLVWIYLEAAGLLRGEQAPVAVTDEHRADRDTYVLGVVTATRDEVLARVATYGESIRRPT